MKAGEYTYSVRLVRPFVTVLRGHPAIPAEVLDAISGRGPDDRVEVRLLQELLDQAIGLTGDVDLGLRAADAINRGDFDVLEFAASSCCTQGDALGVLLRYMPLVNDAAAFSLATRGDRAVFALGSAVPLSRAAADFQAGAFARLFHGWLADGLSNDAEIWFQHAEPPCTDAYSVTFSGRPVRFERPVDALLFPAADLDLALPSADPGLHTMLRRHADELLSRLSRSATFAERVRRAVTDVIASGDASVDYIAERLGMSRRTLGRRLAAEGTTYSDVFESVRRGLALQYLAATSLALHEVAFLLGFSDATAFSRAFKRWMDVTPGEYRRRQSA